MHGERVMAVDDVLYNYRQEVATSSSAQLAEMKGERIYESVFRAGGLVLALKNQAESISMPLANAIEKGLPWFVNRLFMLLVKTNAKERCKFYNALIISTDLHLQGHMNKMNRMVVKYPVMGRITLNVLSVVYKVKNKILC